MLKASRIPGTFDIALLLTLAVIAAAWIFTIPENQSTWIYGGEVLKYWKKGFWELLEFTMQMVLILVLGHALALTKPIGSLLDILIKNVSSNTSAVLTTGFTAMVAGYFNWGFGLIIGAVLAVKIARKCHESSVPINYPLVGASAYLGMMVWHGGLSGSAPLKVAESNHFLVDIVGTIPVSLTIFSPFNMIANGILLLVMLVVLYGLSKRKFSKTFKVPDIKTQNTYDTDKKGLLLGLVMVVLAVVDLFYSVESGSANIDLNYINFLLFGLGLVFYQSLKGFVAGVGVAIQGAVDIILQFPLYAGILGIMKYSGLLEQLSLGLIHLGGANLFPLLTFLSAALFNLFIPSGGGQWAIQGPIIMQAIQDLALDPADMVMVFAFGDQVSNMLQPFWALPLLSLTGLPVKELFKYTSLFFVCGFLVFGLCIWFGL
ncbi:TIGR00366 family protein [Mongoliitalea daihaiensis]|uniref:TIGR00366 family protein n=1 Tax=Mongoliitalea daihaiensis TaxID=2782006 RepID=UPI001F2EE002|nr:TIGR00366 family protein [Mongoliitalea daihaiensis]UJP64826.1 short-chain fatty acid transporter [Mongoliitalea daihaiensis]